MLKESPLREYVPSGIDKIKLRNEFTPVIARIRKYLPPQEIFRLFKSSPDETRGIPAFPYCRVDANVMDARDSVWILNKYPEILADKAEFLEIYGSGSDEAFKALVWVEIGFEGLQNFAVSPASKNWTTAVGYLLKPKDRAHKIMTSGKQLYEKCLRAFTEYKFSHEVPEDLFDKYKLLHLLDPFR